MKYIYTLLICIPLFYQTSAYSQEGFFSADGESSFLKQLENIFSLSAEKKKSKEFLKEVDTFWSSPETTSEIKKTIISLCDEIYAKNGKPFPDYHDYLNTVMSFHLNESLFLSYNSWHNGIMELLSQAKFQMRHAIPLFRYTQDALQNNVLFSTYAIQWKSTSSQLKFEFTDSLYIVTDFTDLYCASSNDTIHIIKTKGRINLMSGQWQGEKGTITWEQSGFSADKVNAQFGTYSVNMNRNEVEIDSVTFRNSLYFNYPLKGKIHHKIVNARTSSYPKFDSYEQVYKIPNIQKDFNYEGGFSQHGPKFLGSGSAEKPAKISIFKNDTLFITASSLYFSLREDQIVSNSSEVTIHLDSDYIYHPGVYFKYMVNLRELHLIRDGKGMAQSPFFNTYHNISMETQLLKWKINEGIIELRMLSGAAQNYASFESVSYFREAFFNKLQGMDAIHPLQGLKNCSKYWEGRPFTAKDYAQFIRMPEYQIRHQVMELSFHGFIKYNVITDYIEIEDRLTDYLLFRVGKKDYDVIQFNSATPSLTPNAIIDLKNYDMMLYGVPAVSISDRQNVVFYPKNQNLLLKKNRNFAFDGSIASGMIDLFGNGFTFNYDKFRVDLNTIDSLVMRVVTGKTDYIGRTAQQKIQNTISQLSGYLEVDQPDNKSGAKNFAHFPRLTSTTNSYVYYDNPSTQGGAYDRESFYFTLDPFEIDSVSYLTRSNISFNGNLESNIFPIINETLLVQSDYSLGFTRMSPQEGYPVYDNKAQFSKEINLSNKGLKGNGTLNYLTSTSESKDFTFLPKRTIGNAYAFKVDERENGVQYPDVQGGNANIEYLPYSEKLIASVTSSPFTLYKNEASILGSLTVSPNGLEGSGQFNIPNAYLTAKRYDLGHHIAIADSSDFNLINKEGSTDVNFRTENLLSTINFKTRNGNFTARDAGSKVEFTDNLYIAYISEFSWDMDKNDIFLGSSGSEGNRFVSTHRRQDSLDFIVPLALYDVKQKKIFAQEVKYVDVADTRMHLSDGKITINQTAVLDSLTKVEIVVNDSIHQFRDAIVHINGKNDYKARGKYDYLNGAKNIKTINFSNITIDKKKKTVAEGTIRDREIFTFNPYFAFKGGVKLNAGEKLLDFKGSTQMLHACSMQGPQDYVRFESKIDPDSVRIPLTEKKQNSELESIYSNFFLNRDSNVLYSAFLEPRLFHSDEPVLTADGILWFNESINSFEIAKANKIANPDTSGNVMRFHKEECKVSGEGNLNMGLSLGQVKTYAAGEVTHYRSSNDTISLNTLFGLDFMLDQASIDMMYYDLLNADLRRTVDSESPENIRRMKEWMDAENAEKVSKELLSLDPLKSLPIEHQHLFAFNDLTWTWDVASRSYLADGEVTLNWMQNKPVSRKVNIKANIVFSRGGNSMNIHIEASKDVFYFFSYRNGMMQTLSSNELYNTNIQAVDAKTRKMKVGFGEQSYSFILSPPSRMKQLLKVFEPGNEPQEVSDEQDLIEEED
ncbi:MAG TPA: hypothetical protein VJ855_02140 [Marinilabiliaceae bacterium]|nr:hypothetical protein [Marinilabiliaceae bacterium]